jgi:hypothetical protein
MILFYFPFNSSLPFATGTVGAAAPTVPVGTPLGAVGIFCVLHFAMVSWTAASLALPAPEGLRMGLRSRAPMTREN